MTAGLYSPTARGDRRRSHVPAPPSGRRLSQGLAAGRRSEFQSSAQVQAQFKPGLRVPASEAWAEQNPRLERAGARPVEVVAGLMRR